jgi:hypothetical protein
MKPMPHWPEIRADPRLAIVLAGALVMGASGTLHAAPDAAPIADEVSIDAGAASTAGENGPVEVAAEPPLTNDQLKVELDEAIGAVKALRDKDSDVRLRVKIAALIAPLLAIAIALVRRWSPKLDAKARWIPYALIALGFAEGFADHLITGAGWLPALITAGGPPLALLWHQLTKQAAKPA